MKTKSVVRNPAKIAEASFSIFYLIYVCIATVIFFINAHNNQTIILYGWLALILGGGDAFHLVPRIYIALKGANKKSKWWSQLGLLISSITMTIFYIILFYIWKSLFGFIKISPLFGITIWITAILRIVLCLLPQNNWFNPDGNLIFSVLRNLPFVITGLCDVILFFMIRNTTYSYMWLNAPAILISFLCYLPVVVLKYKNPKIGMLMIPKTLAYMFIIGLGFTLI